VKFPKPPDPQLEIVLPAEFLRLPEEYLIEFAFAWWLRGYSLSAIAKRFGVSVGRVKRWKAVGQWEEKAIEHLESMKEKLAELVTKTTLAITQAKEIAAENLTLLGLAVRDKIREKEPAEEVLDEHLKLAERLAAAASKLNLPVELWEKVQKQSEEIKEVPFKVLEELGEPRLKEAFDEESEKLYDKPSRAEAKTETRNSRPE